MSSHVEYNGGPSIEEVRDRVKASRIHKLSSNENPLGPRRGLSRPSATPPNRCRCIRRAATSASGTLWPRIMATRSPPEHFLGANSGYELIDLVGRTFLDAGDEIIISSPTYRAYAWAAERQDARVQELQRLSVECWESHANFVLFRPPLAASDVFERLIERGIMVRLTDSNGLPGHLRVSTGLQESNEAFVRALEDVLNEGAQCRD